MDVLEADDDGYCWQCAVCDCHFQITWVPDDEDEGGYDLNVPALATADDHQICEECIDLVPLEWQEDLGDGSLEIEEILPLWRRRHSERNPT